MHEVVLPALEAIVRLSPCQAPPPVAVVTTAAPVREGQSLYLSTGKCLYAINAADGTARWCQQIELIRTREAPHHPLVSSPPPPRVHFAAPRVVNGVVYVCVEGFGASHTCAFAAGDGALRWWTATDARVAAMPFMDYAVPLVADGVVYSGTFALNTHDGSFRWRIPINPREEGTFALHALSDETIYASTTRGIYAINAQDGQIRWRYQSEEPSHVSGPPVVSGRLLYAGTNGLVDYPPKGHCFALDAETGAEVWRSPMGSYVGAVVHDETLYVSSGDRSLYALDKSSGAPRWQHRFAATGYHPATIADDVLYITIIGDGAYALSVEDGAVLWHQSFENSPGVTSSFTPSVVLEGAVYLGRIDNRGWGELYALDAHTEAEYWHTPYPRNSLHSPLAVAL